jgi:hypothetical protein
VAIDEETAKRLTEALRLESPDVWGQLVRPEVTDNVIQVLDQHGRQFAWTGGCESVGAEVSAKLSLGTEGGLPISEPTSAGPVLPESRLSAIPTELRYYDLARAVVHAPIEFANVPLP